SASRWRTARPLAAARRNPRSAVIAPRLRLIALLPASRHRAAPPASAATRAPPRSTATSPAKAISDPLSTGSQRRIPPTDSVTTKHGASGRRAPCKRNTHHAPSLLVLRRRGSPARRTAHHPGLGGTAQLRPDPSDRDQQRHRQARLGERPSP